jgi:terminase large subunit-like protein
MLNPFSRMEYRVLLKKPHAKQLAFLSSTAKRKVIRAGRRAGKTTGVSILAVQSFLAGRRVLYAAPTAEQLGQFWKEVKTSLSRLIDDGVFYKNETEHTIERLGTNQRIKAKTAWNADTLRGDFADLLILDEWQLMEETAWEDVGVPMLLDNHGEAVFVYTPPSIRSQAQSRAQDPRHAAKLYKKAVREREESLKKGETPYWEAFHFCSQDNPHISEAALQEVIKEMSNLSYRQEILAEDIEEAPHALWIRTTIEQSRVHRFPTLVRIGVGVDPPGGATECGIIVAGFAQCSCKGFAEQHAFVIQDRSLKDTPEKWAREAVAAYHSWKADRMFIERNFGGDMVESTIRTVDPNISFKMVTASRGKALRAEPVAALYEQLKIHHVGQFNALEDEMTSWQPGLSSFSPNRMDALVWVLTELMLGEGAYEAASAGFDSGEDPNEMGLDMLMRPRRFPRVERPWPSVWGEVDEFGNGMFG